jgi:hypothetical protein
VVQLLFQGTGARWIGELTRKDHPFHELFESVKDKVARVSTACAVFFGSSEDVKTSRLPFANDNPVPGTSGLPSLGKLTQEGFTVLSF